jgi:hypothetical protein
LISGQAPTAGTAGAETSSGLSQLMGAATVVLKAVVKNIDDFLVTPLINTYYHFNMEWARDESIKGDMKVSALGSEVLIAKEVQNKNMTDFLAITANEFDMPLIKRPNILRKIVSNMGFESEDAIKTDTEIQKELAKPDPIKEKLNELAIEKAELENAEIQSRIAVNQSERDKNISEAKYKGEFLRQRRIKLAEDIKLARKQLAESKQEGGNQDVKKKIKTDAKPVKNLNEK